MENKVRLSSQMVIGIIIFAMGILFFLDNLNILYFHDVWRFWPMAFVVFGVIKFRQARGVPGRTIGGMFILIGLLMTINRLGLIDIRFREWWPLVLVVVGVAFILRAFERQKVNLEVDEKGDPIDRSSAFDVVAVLSGANRKSSSPDFRSAEVTAIMGGCDIDLRNASIAEGQAAVLDVFAFWGGIDVRIPLDWNVAYEGTALLGAIEDKTVEPQTKTKTLIVRGYAIMAGVEIRN